MISALIVLGAMAQGPTLSKEADVNDLIQRMMAFDKNGDGSLTESEITDARLRRLFTRADADKNGLVTKAELTVIGEAEHSDTPDFDSRPRGRRQPPR